MLATRYPKILAFVEGTMERNFVNQNFKYVHVIEISNGSSWSLDRICEQISSKFAVHNGNPEMVLIWLDREKREEPSCDFADKIKDSLFKRGAPKEKIVVCVADRTSENAILADEELVVDEFGIPGYKYCGDGNFGKAVLKKLYQDKGLSYRETFHGVGLLKKMRLSNAKKNSAFVSSFFDSLELQCWWK
jgi:hypothetical protein